MPRHARPSTVQLVPLHDPVRLIQQHYAPLGYPVHEAGLTADTIDVRVDWDGDGTRIGRFEVKTGDGSWHMVKNLATDLDANDVIFPTSKVHGDSLALRFQRGPAHADVPFRVRALPIDWRVKLPSARMLSPDHVVTRGTDYRYRIDGAADDPRWWRGSEPAADGGAHAVTLPLAKGTDYEVWVSLRSPTEPDRWSPVDPIVRTEDPDPIPDPD